MRSPASRISSCQTSSLSFELAPLAGEHEKPERAHGELDRHVEEEDEVKRGRQSAEELGLAVIDVQRQRLKPPPYLKKEERVIFEHVVSHSAPMHFKENEAPLLALYCTSIHLARFYAGNIGSEGDTGHNHKQWVENARLSASLATKLRLTPQTRFDARAAERYSAVPSDDAPRPWDRRAHHESGMGNARGDGAAS
jgi:phage terminase small subunit